MVLVGDIAIGVTIHETMEEAESVRRDGKCVRYEPPKASPTSRRRPPMFAHEHVSKHWFPTSRFGLHAYEAQGIAWDQTWIETAAGDLSTSFGAIAKALDGAVPKIGKLRMSARARRRG